MLHNKRFAAGYVPGFQKTYLTREMTRAMSIDHPIGDPHGGPAFGERNDPISAIISIGTMFATGGAVLAGTATLMQGLMFAGAALSLVGNISGNKTLSKIGMVVGLAGGVGALAESAGMFTSGTMGETFGYGAQSGAPGAALSQTVNPAADVVTSPVNMPGPVEVTDLGPLGGEGFNPAPASPAAEALTGTPGAPSQGLVNSNIVAPAETLAATPSSIAPATPPAPSTVGVPEVSTISAPQVTAPTAGYQSITNPAMPGQEGYGWQNFVDPATGQAVSIDPAGKYFYNGGNQAMSQITGAGGQAMGFSDYAGKAWQGIKSIGSSWTDLAKTNPGVALMMGNTISSVADVLSGKAGATVDALEAQGQLSRAQAEKLRFEMEEYKRRVAQQNTNYTSVSNPLATWDANIQTTPVNRPNPNGLVAGQMKPPGG